jgi:G3E family GTPase
MIPVGLVTGFLGSGKTTLIAALLRDPALAGTLVIVNEFGEVGIDHDLLEASSDDTILLANGCLCCTIRGNLVDTLLDVERQVADGRLRPFDRVLVETSGVVDPGPVLAFVFADPRIAARYTPGAVVTTVDAVGGEATLDRHPEALAQVVHADRLLLTKPDLVAPKQIEELAARLRALNPGATLAVAVAGEGVDAALLASPTGHRHHECAPGCDDPAHDHHHHAAHGHEVRFRTMLLRAERPLAEPELPALIAAIGATAGAALLRLKGILPLAGGLSSAVIQAVPGLVHPPALLPPRPGEEGRLVLIAEGEPPAALLNALAGFGLRPVPVLPAPH